MATWRVYILRCGDGSLYTGVTTDLGRRIAAHAAGKGGKYTRARLPVVLAWSAEARSKSAAFRREARIKGWSRAEKLRFLASKK